MKLILAYTVILYEFDDQPRCSSCPEVSFHALSHHFSPSTTILLQQPVGYKYLPPHPDYALVIRVAGIPYDTASAHI